MFGDLNNRSEISIRVTGSLIWIRILCFEFRFKDSDNRISNLNLYILISDPCSVLESKFCIIRKWILEFWFASLESNGSFGYRS